MSRHTTRLTVSRSSGSRTGLARESRGVVVFDDMAWPSDGSRGFAQATAWDVTLMRRYAAGWQTIHDSNQTRGTAALNRPVARPPPATAGSSPRLRSP